MASRQRIVERVAAPFTGARVDREKGVIGGALICGLKSANARDYDRQSFGDGSQYKGRHVYLNHGRERRAEDKIGWFENIRFRADGTPEGDFHVLKSHPMAAVVLEAAERNPGLFGFSHVADCRTSQGAGGRVRVEAVEDVLSVDLVADPATTHGLFEHRGGKPMKVKEYLQKLAPKLLVNQLLVANKVLKEFGEPDMTADAPAPDAADTAGGDGVTAAVKAAASAEIEECLQNASSPDAVKRCLQRLKKILGLHGELSGEEGGGGGGEEEEEEETPKESKGKKPEMAAVVRECVAAKFDPKGHDLIALSGMSDPADRKTYIEARLAESRPAERVTSAGRRPGSGAAGKTPTQEQKTEPERLIPKW